MKTDKTKKTNQREYYEELTEEQLTKLLQEAYKDEIPVLSEELLQKTLQQVKMTEQASQKQSSVPTSFVTKWISNVVVKRCALVGAMCILLFVCGKMVKENGGFVEKSAAPEMWDAESAKNNTNGAMDFNSATSNGIGMLADSAESITQENGATDEECADGFPQAESGTTDTSAAEKVEEEVNSLLETETGTIDDSTNEQIEQEAENNVPQNGLETQNEEKAEQVKTENEQNVSKEDLDKDTAGGVIKKENIYEGLAKLLPIFPKELYETENVYEFWIDGVQVESGWESYLEHALRHSPPEPLALQNEEIDGMTEVDTLPVDTFFQKEDILFTLIVSSEEITYCMEVGTCTKVTIEQNGEKRSTFFAILDLTLYEEILTIKS